jgi:hypothetical protein
VFSTCLQPEAKGVERPDLVLLENRPAFKREHCSLLDMDLGVSGGEIAVEVRILGGRRTWVVTGEEFKPAGITLRSGSSDYLIPKDMIGLERSSSEKESRAPKLCVLNVD